MQRAHVGRRAGRVIATPNRASCRCRPVPHRSLTAEIARMAGSRDRPLSLTSLVLRRLSTAVRLALLRRGHRSAVAAPLDAAALDAARAARDLRHAHVRLLRRCRASTGACVAAPAVAGAPVAARLSFLSLLSLQVLIARAWSGRSCDTCGVSAGGVATGAGRRGLAADDLRGGRSACDGASRWDGRDAVPSGSLLTAP